MSSCDFSGVPVGIRQAQTRNHAGEYARKLLRNQSAVTDAQLWNDYDLLLSGHAIYLQQVLCEESDYSILSALTTELTENMDVGMINWSKHFKHENPTFSPTFLRIVQALSDYFDMEVYATRLNFYPDATSWKPFHHDSHAYGGKGQREDFTVGASFGGTRSLVFKHVQSDHQFDFPQRNGDIFAFTSAVNQRFQHSVPKVAAARNQGPRISIIAWGRRRSLQNNNAGKDEVGTREREETTEDTVADNGSYDDEEEKEIAVTAAEVQEMVSAFVAQKEREKERQARANESRQDKSRVQGSWNRNKGGRGGGSQAGRSSRGGSGSKQQSANRQVQTSNTASKKQSYGWA